MMCKCFLLWFAFFGLLYFLLVFSSFSYFGPRWVPVHVGCVWGPWDCPQFHTWEAPESLLTGAGGQHTLLWRGRRRGSFNWSDLAVVCMSSIAGHYVYNRSKHQNSKSLSKVHISQRKSRGQAVMTVLLYQSCAVKHLYYALPHTGNTSHHQIGLLLTQRYIKVCPTMWKAVFCCFNSNNLLGKGKKKIKI